MKSKKLLKSELENKGKKFKNPSCSCHEEKAADEKARSLFSAFLPALLSFLLLLTGILLEYYQVQGFHPVYDLVLFLIAYLVVGWKVLWKAVRELVKGQIFSEHFLMSIATLGAFAIHQFAEAVTVMLFYEIGELFQGAAVNRSKRSIKALLDIRPQIARVLRDGRFVEVAPAEIEIGEVIQVLAGEKVALDGMLLSERATFDTAALTGESQPRSLQRAAVVLSGMINLNQVVEIKTTRRFEDSALAKILDLVQNAASQKAKTQLFITRFAKFYTPVVVFLAIALTFFPSFFVEDYVFSTWLYRALIFLVISCPCALVISIPLGYFGGIGAASHRGILFKGSNYLDLLTDIDTVVLDKTGTLTQGVFKVQQVRVSHFNQEEFVSLVGALAKKSSHPVAKAIAVYAAPHLQNVQVSEVEEISGHGLKGRVGGKELLLGNRKLLAKFGISYEQVFDQIADTIVLVAINGNFAGHFVIADEIKADAKQAVQALHHLGIHHLVMLSGDREKVVKQVAQDLGIDFAYGDLLPQDKVAKVKALKMQYKRIVVVGDGVNDAPVLALADVGIAMGGLGSDAAIEAADVVIQNDQPLQIATAIKISKATKRIVWQNIGFAFGVKALFLILGAFGMATLWEAVFADTGVALLAIFNAMRLQRKSF